MTNGGSHKPVNADKSKPVKPKSSAKSDTKKKH